MTLISMTGSDLCTLALQSHFQIKAAHQREKRPLYKEVSKQVIAKPVQLWHEGQL